MFWISFGTFQKSVNHRPSHAFSYVEILQQTQENMGMPDAEFYTKAGGSGSHSGYAVHCMQHMALLANPFVKEEELDRIDQAACAIKDLIHNEHGRGTGHGGARQV